MPSLHWMAVETGDTRTISVVAEKRPVQTLARPRRIYGKTLGSTKEPMLSHSVEVQVNILKKLVETKIWGFNYHYLINAMTITIPVCVFMYFNWTFTLYWHSFMPRKFLVVLHTQQVYNTRLPYGQLKLQATQSRESRPAQPCIFETVAKFGLHEINMKFNTQNEE